MLVAFAVRTEPEIEFVHLSFYLTESESEAAVLHLSEQFADDVPVEMDWVGFPNDPLPTSVQMADPSYVQEIHDRIIEAYFGEPQWIAEMSAVIHSGDMPSELSSDPLPEMREAEIIQWLSERSGFSPVLALYLRRETADKEQDGGKVLSFPPD